MQQNTKINERFHSVLSGHFGVSTEREQRLVYFLFCNVKMKSYIRELENGYVSAPFCTYSTVLSSARTVVRYTVHSAGRKSRPVWLLTRIPEMKNRKEKYCFFQFYETLNSVEGFFLLLPNQQAGATTRFRDTRAFYVAQSAKRILFTFACVFTLLKLQLLARKIKTNLLKRT